MSLTSPGIARPLHRRQAFRFSYLVVGYLTISYWIAQQYLSGWISNPDVNFYLVQPAIWLGLGALSYAGWRRLPWRPRFSRVFVITALSVGVVHVAVLVASGLVGGMATVRVRFDLLVYVENTWFVGSLLLGLETARTYLFHVWAVRSPEWARVVVVVLFFVAATPLGLFEAVGETTRAAETIGGSLVPALAISIVATWFAEHGGMGASLAYRAPILAFLWYSMVLPDLHWSTTLAVGVIAPAIAWSLAQPLAAALTDSQMAHDTTA